MFRTALSAFAYWRAQRLDALAADTGNAVERGNLRDRSLIWQSREQLFDGLVTPRTHALSVAMLKRSIAFRNNSDRRRLTPPGAAAVMEQPNSSPPSSAALRDASGGTAHFPGGSPSLLVARRSI